MRNFVPSNIDSEKVAVKVDVTELMGNEIFLYLVSGKNTFVARVDPRSELRVGEQAQVAFNMDNYPYLRCRHRRGDQVKSSFSRIMQAQSPGCA